MAERSGVPGDWTSDQLHFLADSPEIEISATRRGGEPGRWVTIWVVVDRGEVLVRTWHRRDTGWYGNAVSSGRAWMRVSDDQVRVSVAPIGRMDAPAVSAAYRAKYGDGAASSMVTAEAEASTLRLAPASADRADRA